MEEITVTQEVNEEFHDELGQTVEESWLELEEDDYGEYEELRIVKGETAEEIIDHLYESEIAGLKIDGDFCEMAVTTPSQNRKTTHHWSAYNLVLVERGLRRDVSERI